MEGALNGRIALVTGGSRGIGRAIAVSLARAGADVMVNYRSESERALAVCEEIRKMGRRALAVQADVSQGTDVSRLVEAARRELGGVTILVNNAGIGRQRSIDEVMEQDWHEHLAVNLTSCFLAIQAALPDMRTARWGRIISISSVAAQLGGVVGPHYAASKAGIHGLTHYYAAHLAAEGITVNVIAPGPVRTDLVAALPRLTPAMVPVGRFGTPEEIAEVATMLACNGYITGQTLNVNGGRYMS